MCRCEACGTALAGMCHHNQEQWRYYRCNHKNNHYAGLEMRCEQKSVRADVLEPIVWNYILDLWSDNTDLTAHPVWRPALRELFI